MGKKFWSMFSLLALTSLCLIYIGLQFYHLNYINDAQLGYTGAILGGVMTLIGVCWTIINQEKQRREDLAMQYKPIISLEFLNETTINFPVENAVLSFSLELKNIGRGELMNISVEYTQYDNPYLFIMTYQKNQIIYQNNTTNILINISKAPNLSLEKIEKSAGSHSMSEIYPININDEINFMFSIVFNDAFLNRYVYTYTIKFDYKTSVDLKRINNVSFNNGVPHVILNDSVPQLDTTPRWIAHISTPKIEYKSK